MTAGYPSEEPIAGKPHDGICGGESQQWLSYPTNLPVRFVNPMLTLCKMVECQPNRGTTRRQPGRHKVIPRRVLAVIKGLIGDIGIRSP